MTIKTNVLKLLWAAVFGLILATVGATAYGASTQEPAPASQPAGLTGKALYDEAISISKLLRDPASANYTLFDSESAIAGELKARIYEMLRQGKSREEIFDFMVARYGEMIRYEPDFNAKTALLWIAPWAVLVAGCGLLVLRMRRHVKKSSHQRAEKE